MKATGILAWVHGYFLRTSGDTAVVYRADTLITKRHVPGLHRFLMRARTPRFGWGRFPNDGDEVIYLFDAADENFGYAVNLDDPHGSEWGYAPSGVQVEQAV